MTHSTTVGLSHFPELIIGEPYLSIALRKQALYFTTLWSTFKRHACIYSHLNSQSLRPWKWKQQILGKIALLMSNIINIIMIITRHTSHVDFGTYLYHRTQSMVLHAEKWLMYEDITAVSTVRISCSWMISLLWTIRNTQPQRDAANPVA
jgi:hypothetical protein